MRDAIQAKVMELLRSAGEASGFPGRISLDAKLRDLAIDSIKLVEMLFELEKSLGFEADEEELARIGTVRDLVDLVESAVGSNAT